MLTLKPGPVEVGGVRLKNHLVPRGRRPRHDRGLARPGSHSRNGAGGVVTEVDRARAHARPRRAVPGPLEDGLLNAMGLPNPSRAFVEESGPSRASPWSPRSSGAPRGVRRGRVLVRRLRRRARAEPLLPSRRGLRGRARLGPRTRRGVHPGRGRLGLPVWVRLDPERRRTSAPSAGPPSRAGPRPSSRSTRSGPCGSHPASAGPSVGNRYGGLGAGRLPGRGPVRDRALRGRLDFPVVGCGGVASRTTWSRCSWPARPRSRSARPVLIGDANVFATIGPRSTRRTALEHGRSSWGAPMREIGAVTVVEAVAETPSVTTRFSFDRAFAFEPGQFVMVSVPAWTRLPMALSSRRTPISVQRVGEATEALCALEPGDRIGVRGPYRPGLSRRRQRPRGRGRDRRGPAPAARRGRAGRDLPPRRPARGRAFRSRPARGRRPPARHRRRVGRAPRLRRGPPRRGRPRVVRARSASAAPSR